MSDPNQPNSPEKKAENNSQFGTARYWAARNDSASVYLGAALDEIDRLRAENERLRKALEFYATMRVEIIMPHGSGMKAFTGNPSLGDRAREALAGKDGDEDA